MKTFSPSTGFFAGWFIICMFQLQPLLAQSVEVTLNPIKDNTLYGSSNGNISNGSGDFIFTGRSNQTPELNSYRRALIQFDLSEIPEGAEVTGVSLRMHMSKTIAGNSDVFIHRVTASWGEGESNANSQEGSGAPAASGDATWLHRTFNTNQWTTAGGDYLSTVSSSASIGGNGFYTWTGSGLVADVQSWLEDAESNHGWVLIGDEFTAPTAKRFASREHPTVENRPLLTLTYNEPVSVERTDGIRVASIRLHQNYPNPFNPVTVIAFEYDASVGVTAPASGVRLAVYDVLGRRVATLLEGALPSGSHSVVFDGGDLPSGVYLYRLEAGSVMVTKRMMLAK